MEQKRGAGFDTFQKTVIAAVLISIAFFISLPVIRHWMEPPHNKTLIVRSLIRDIGVAISDYESDWGAFPPDIDPTGGTSSQSLFFHLTHAFRTEPNSAKGELWASKDVGPYLDLSIAHQTTSPEGHVTIVDQWGQPLEYDNIRDDRSTPDGFTRRGADDIRTDGKPRNLQGVDIFSHGAPGKNRPLANFKCEWEQ